MATLAASAQEWTWMWVQPWRRLMRRSLAATRVMASSRRRWGSERPLARLAARRMRHQARGPARRVSMMARITSLADMGAREGVCRCAASGQAWEKIYSGGGRLDMREAAL